MATKKAATVCPVCLNALNATLESLNVTSESAPTNQESRVLRIGYYLQHFDDNRPLSCRFREGPGNFYLSHRVR